MITEDYTDFETAKLLKEKGLTYRGMLDSTGVLSAWEECMSMLKDKDFQNDSWRLAYNAFLEGFRIGYMQVMQKEPERQIDEEFPKIVSDEKIEQMGEEISKAAVDNIKEQFSKIVEEYIENWVDSKVKRNNM